MEKIRQCLLIDDDLDDQDIFLMALQQADKNMTCVMANDGISALKRLRTEITFVPDYIFLDINMPKMNGIQCLPEIKKLDHLKNVEIIMYSTSADEKIIAKSKELGAAGFLIKPAGLVVLAKALANILDSKRSAS